jgi:HlyD family secretion protein
VTNADAGFVQPEQRARVKVAAYPFQKYGMLDGRVQQISADAQDKTASAEGAARSPPELAYRALIRLEAGELTADGRKLKLVPGMAVAAEMHIGRRTVLEYLLSPVQKVTAEAARER